LRSGQCHDLMRDPTTQARRSRPRDVPPQNLVLCTVKAAFRVSRLWRMRTRGRVQAVEGGRAALHQRARGELFKFFLSEMAKRVLYFG
jgi:hypothetical protein